MELMQGPDLIDAPTVRRFGIGLRGCSESSCPQQAPLNRVLEPGLNSCGCSLEGDVTLAKPCSPAFAWNIWRERNRHIFKSETKQQEQVWGISPFRLRLGLHT